MKKITQDITLLNKNLVGKKNLETNTIKTTNVIILLNRVRLDKKKDRKKKIIILSILVLSISTITIFLII